MIRHSDAISVMKDASWLASDLMYPTGGIFTNFHRIKENIIPSFCADPYTDRPQVDHFVFTDYSPPSYPTLSSIGSR